MMSFSSRYLGLNLANMTLSLMQAWIRSQVFMQWLIGLCGMYGWIILVIFMSRFSDGLDFDEFSFLFIFAPFFSLKSNQPLNAEWKQTEKLAGNSNTLDWKENINYFIIILCPIMILLFKSMFHIHWIQIGKQTEKLAGNSNTLDWK